jgi:hypothetical protein
MTVAATIGGGLTGGGINVQIDLATHQRCVLDRMPHVTLLAADGAVVTDATAYQPAGSPPRSTTPIDKPLSAPIVLGVGQTAEMPSYWYDVCAPVHPRFRVRVALADGSQVIVAPAGGSAGAQGGSGPPRCISSATTRQRLPSGTLVLAPIHVLA